MSKVSRNDIYVRDEQGGEWFNDFLRSLAEQPAATTTTQSIMEAINQKKGETVEGVVSEYRKMVGLDAIADEETSDDEIKAEAAAPLRPISKRHAQLMLADDDEDEKEDKDVEPESVIVLIEGDSNIKGDLESILENSGGTRNTHAIINFLRGMLGSDLVSYSDDQLKGYIEDMKAQYTVDTEEPRGDVGRVGMEESDYYDDKMADFVEHGKGV